MERRGRIPVAKFRTQEAKTRSRSRVREPDYNEQDPEHDLFTLMEDNIALKEDNKALKLEIEAQKTAQAEQRMQQEKLSAELEALQQRQCAFESQIKELQVKCTKAQNERNALDKLHKMKVDQIHNLTSELEHLREKQHEQSQQTNKLASNAIVGSAQLKRNLLKIVQQGSTDLDSIVDVDAKADLPITVALVERLVDEFLVLKSASNAVELQLYEANEKMAELLEQQHNLEEDNETLRTENANLTKVAKLLTENMKESVETSQKMETALIKLKQRNDELTAKTRDLTDGQPTPPSPTMSPTMTSTTTTTTLNATNVEFEEIKEQVQQQTREHNERIVEMQKLMDAALAKTTNDELKKLQLKLDILEEQLRLALARADCAEQELAHYQSQSISSTSMQFANTVVPALATPPPPPPPPPPPMPRKLLYVAQAANAMGEGGSGGGGGSAAASGSGFTFSDNIAGHNLHKGSDKIIDTVKQQVQVQATAATGLDALVREFKSGRVTLRRNRRKTSTNEALQEMFQVLEISQKQNRNSKICVDMHI